MTKDDGGPAFPTKDHPHIHADYCHGMTLRDWFAVHASEEDIDALIPKTVGEMADLLVRLGRIKPGWRQLGSALDAYRDEHKNGLRQWARYCHADAMLAARKDDHDGR